MPSNLTLHLLLGGIYILALVNAILVVCQQFDRTIPDQQVYAINDNTLYSQGYKATIIYIKPSGKDVHFKTQFSAINGAAGNIMTLAVTNHYVDLNGKDGPRFINPFTLKLAAWRNKKIRNMTFYYPRQHKFNVKKADSLIQQVVKVESEWDLEPINIRYYYAKNYDELQILKGFDFALFMGNQDKPSGISDDRDNQVFCAGLGENYFHEVVHVYLNRLYPKSPLKEGLAAFYGGSMGHNLKWHLKRVDSYLEEHQEANLNAIEDFWYPDPYTNPGSAVRALICQIIYKKDGIVGLKRLMSYTSFTDIFKQELKVNDRVHIPINLTPFRQFQIDPQSCCLKKAEVVVQKGILELIFYVLFNNCYSTKIRFQS